MAGHEGLAGAGWAEKQDSLDVLTAKEGDRFIGLLTYLAGHESLAGAGWAVKHNSLDVHIKPSSSLLCRLAVYLPVPI